MDEILGTRSNQEIILLKTAFKEGKYYRSAHAVYISHYRYLKGSFKLYYIPFTAYGKELERDIQGDTHGHYKTALLALCKVRIYNLKDIT